jgi:hypothetical protein
MGIEHLKLSLQQLAIEQHLALADKSPAHSQRDLEQRRWAVTESLQLRQQGLVHFTQRSEDAKAIVEKNLDLSLDLGDLLDGARHTIDHALDVE